MARIKVEGDYSHVITNIGCLIKLGGAGGVVQWLRHKMLLENSRWPHISRVCVYTKSSNFYL